MSAPFSAKLIQKYLDENIRDVPEACLMLSAHRGSPEVLNFMYTDHCELICKGAIS